MEQPRKGLQLANNITELTAIAPLKEGGAEALRALFAERRRDERQGLPSPIERIESIHYARWVILDGGTRLLFTSNFDGDLDSYLAEFAERDEGPLNAVFRYCVGWPGARPVDRFIQYVREYMVPAEYYYAAYPQYTVKEVKRALDWKDKTETFIRDWLPPLADTAEAIESKTADAETVDAMRRKIRAFLRTLAIPTPEDFGKQHPQEGGS